MAKVGMVCPFSGRACVECPSYRGRHYLLCYCEKYRGYIKSQKKRAKKSEKNGKFEMPVLVPTCAFDPFVVERDQ